MINDNYRPTGEKKEDYKGSDQWTYKQWAWEFLRRNREFQEWCYKIENSNQTLKLKNRQARDEYGLERYKHYAEPFIGDGVNQAKFLTSDIRSWSRVTAKQQKTKPFYPAIPLRQGEVIVKFYVLAGSKSKKSISAQLRAAKELLLKRSDQWIKRKKGKQAMPSRHRQSLLTLLRLLDARDYNIYLHSISMAELMKEVDIFFKIFPHKKPNNKKIRGESNGLAKQKVSCKRLFEAAEKYTTVYYLDLAATENSTSKINKPHYQSSS